MSLQRFRSGIYSLDLYQHSQQYIYILGCLNMQLSAGASIHFSDLGGGGGQE